jgi:hypothetical protein
VLVLPSSSLLETQERLQNFMRGRGGIPGITQPSQSQESQGGARPQGRPSGAEAKPGAAPRPSGAQRPAGAPPTG